MGNGRTEIAAGRGESMGIPWARRRDFSWRREGQRIGHFLSWLGGGDPAGFRTEARLFATLLPEGVRAASQEAVGRAASAALLRHGLAGGVVVRFVFSALSMNDQEKALVVMESLISIIPASDVPALVRMAVVTRPRLALPLARAAMAWVPTQSTNIWEAAVSVVVGLADTEPYGGPCSVEGGGLSHPPQLP